MTDGTLAFVNYEFAGEVPLTGTVLYSASVWSESGEVGYQLGTKFHDGLEIAQYIYDYSEASQANLSNGTVHVANQVNARYPLKNLPGLGDSFTWSATVTVEGTDVDRCPDGEESSPFPDQP